MGKQYVDDEDGFTYQTTRVVVEKGLIVSYRIPVQTDGTATSIEEDHPVFVKDVVRMLSAPSEPALVDPLIHRKVKNRKVSQPQGNVNLSLNLDGLHS